jgi:hypothetical protein
MGFNPARVADKGAISPQTLPLLLGFLSYPSPNQGPVSPPKRVPVCLTASHRLRLCPLRTPANKNQTQPGSGCRQGGGLTSNLATALCLSLSYPSPTQDPVNAPRRVVAGRTTALRLRLRPCLTLSSKNQLHTRSGCRQGGDFTLNLTTVLCPSLLPATHPRPRCSTKTSRRRPRLLLGLRPCLTPARKNQAQPSSGCRQWGDITSNLATALRLSLIPVTHPRPR